MEGGRTTEMEGILSNYITPGCRVDLQAVERVRLTQDGKEKPKRVHQSEVIDIISEDRIEISMPMEKSKLVLLPVDGEYDMYFYGNNALYQCYARVADRYKSNNLYVLVMDLTSNLRRHQRREYYRFSCALEMDSRQLDEEEIVYASNADSALIPELPLKSSIIVDISGGGLRFVANYAYDVDSLILCKYHLIIGEECKEYNLVGKVLSVNEIEVENWKGLYEHRVQYVNMDKTEREEIIRYIFDEERKVLKNQRGQTEAAEDLMDYPDQAGIGKQD